jgi:hypothetical protein
MPRQCPYRGIAHTSNTNEEHVAEIVVDEFEAGTAIVSVIEKGKGRVPFWTAIQEDSAKKL